jgi:hypothetical protein
VRSATQRSEDSVPQLAHSGTIRTLILSPDGRHVSFQEPSYVSLGSIPMAKECKVS